MKYELIKNSANDLHHFVRTVLENRNIKNVEELIQSNKEDLEDNSYDDLNNINEGVNLLLEHIQNKDKIALVIDPDVDGITSSAILVNYLNKQYIEDEIPEPNWVFVTHEGKGHGFSTDITIPNDVKLIITPDGGSNDFDKHKEWKDKGVDILVIDHHIVEKESEYAIVINNQTSQNYKNKAFSGVGVVYRFLQALDDKFFSDFADEYLDLVALGNISDIMDTKDYETRYFIQQGILKENLKNPFLKILIRKVGAEQMNDVFRYIYPVDVSFKIAPIVNALLRLGTVQEKEDLFRCFISPENDLSTRSGICKETINKMLSYKESQDEEKKELLNKVTQDITEDDLTYPVLVLDVTGLIDNNEIIGLTAMNLASMYKRPVILGTEKFPNSISGSVRVNNGFPEKDFKEICTQSELFDFAQGHSQAFGFAYKKENQQKIKDYFKEKFGCEALSTFHYVDFIIPDIQIISSSDFYLIQNYKYLWGKGIEEPTFAIESIGLNPNLLSTLGKNKDTVKYTHSLGEFMFFKCNEDEEILKIANGDYDKSKVYSLNIVGKLGISTFAGRTKNQIIVDDYEIIEEDDLFDF